MADVKWIKLSTDIFDNRKIKQIESMPEGDALVVIWLKLLILAGVINEGGCVYFTKDIPYTEELLATQFNRPINTIRLALQTFQQFGMIEIINDIIMVSNWEKYQNIEGMDRIREQTRLRVAKHRAKQKNNLLKGATICAYCGGEGETIDHVIPKTKGGLDIPENTVPCCLSCNLEKTNRDVEVFLNDRLLMGEPVNVDAIVNNNVLKNYVSFDYQQNRFVTLRVTHGNATDIDIDKEIDKDIDNPPYNPPTEFDEFWAAYPKKVGKADARKAFAKAIKTVDLDTMLNAISVQKESDQWSRDNGKYIPNPSTWLNQGRWDDELAPKGITTKNGRAVRDDAFWERMAQGDLGI